MESYVMGVARLGIFRLIVGMSVLSIVGFGCEGASKQPTNKVGTKAVQTTLVKEEVVTSTEDVPGSFSSSLRALIEAKVQSRIERVLVVPGQRVKANDLVAELDEREFRTKLDQASTTRDQAEKELVRNKVLFQKGAVSQKELDAADAKANIARAGVSEAETYLSFTKIKAPYDGVIARKLLDVGDLATPGKPVLEIQDPGVLEFQADIPAGLIAGIKQGLKLVVRASAYSMPIEGVVTEIAPAADPNSRTFLIKLRLAATEGLRAGQFGRVEIPLGEKQIVSVPPDALITRGQLEYVFIKDKDSARLRIVRSGKKFPNGIEILSGLSPGDELVISGAQSLIDGDTVTIKS